MTKNVQKKFQSHFCDQWSISFSLKSFYQIQLTWSNHYLELFPDVSNLFFNVVFVLNVSFFHGICSSYLFLYTSQHCVTVVTPFLKCRADVPNVLLKKKNTLTIKWGIQHWLQKTHSENFGHKLGPKSLKHGWHRLLFALKYINGQA